MKTLLTFLFLVNPALNTYDVNSWVLTCVLQEVATTCTMVGDAYYDSVLAEQNNYLAIKFYTEGCELGDPIACDKLAIFYTEGIIVVANPVLAAQYSNRAICLRQHTCI